MMMTPVSIGVNKINHLQMYHLLRFCQQHELDPHLIDKALTYSENKDYLDSLVPNFDPENRLNEWEQTEEWYMENFFLEHYISCIRDGSIVSEDTGHVDASKPLFSLRLMKHVSFSLSAFAQEHKV